MPLPTKIAATNKAPVAAPTLARYVVSISGPLQHRHGRPASPATSSPPRPNVMGPPVPTCPVDLANTGSGQLADLLLAGELSVPARRRFESRRTHHMNALVRRLMLRIRLWRRGRRAASQKCRIGRAGSPYSITT